MTKIINLYTDIPKPEEGMNYVAYCVQRCEESRDEDSIMHGATPEEFAMRFEELHKYGEAYYKPEAFHLICPFCGGEIAVEVD